MMTQADLTNKHIIVVEDNVNNYNLILRLLTEMGIERCDWISSGWKVAEEAENYEQIDLILLDIQLPYEDGFAVQNKLRKHSQLKTTSIVAVTANASETYMQRAINAGFDGFIGKPIDPDRFPDQIRRVLEGKAVWEWQ
ncbi:MAG: response regulator [Anaerolineae bacterium]|nr:response regulator [Anaerolineae bacterium]